MDSTNPPRLGIRGRRIKMEKSISQFRAEQYVTNGLMAGLSYDQIETGAATVQFSTGGATLWFRKHVSGFCAQERQRSADRAVRAEAHQARLNTMIEVDGCRLEKGRFGSKNKTAWRVWLKTGGHVLVYLNGRVDLTPEQALAEALASGKSGFY